VRVEAAGASPAEIAAIVAALDELRARETAAPVASVSSRWKSAARAFNDGYDELRSLRGAGSYRRGYA
jgi:hypothetical protein